MLELFPLHGCERIGNEEPYPVSIDSIVKKCEESEDKLEKEENSSSDS